MAVHHSLLEPAGGGKHVAGNEVGLDVRPARSIRGQGLRPPPGRDQHLQRADACCSKYVRVANIADNRATAEIEVVLARSPQEEPRAGLPAVACVVPGVRADVSAIATQPDEFSHKVLLPGFPAADSMLVAKAEDFDPEPAQDRHRLYGTLVRHEVLGVAEVPVAA